LKFGNGMKNLMIRCATVVVLCLVCCGSMTATNYYWRAIASNNNFNDIMNWETSPGGGGIPSTAPSATDDVFFPVLSNFGISNLNPIYFNNGNCRDFNVTSTTDFFFSGNLTGIYGSLNCPNGTGRFSFNNPQNLNGTGSHFINMGTSAQNITNGGLLFTNITNTGTYTLLSPLNTRASLNFQSQNIISNGFPITGIGMTIGGTGTKTIDFSNSLVTINTTGNGGTLFFDADSVTTNYAFANTDFVLNHQAASFNTGIVVTTGVGVTFDELTINTTVASNNTTFIEARGSGVALTSLSVRVFHLNSPNLALGRAGFVNTNTSAQAEGVLNVGTLEFQRPSTIANDKGFTWNVGAIVETPICRGQSAFLCQGASPMRINTSTPITTTSIAYFGNIFGGSGITASSSYNLGSNSGTISWGGATTSTTFWWVGGAGNWEDPTQWSIFGSNGAPQSAAGCIPTVQDDVNFDAASFTGAQIVTIGATNGFCKNISWTGSNLGTLAGGRLIASTNYSGNLYVNGSANFAGASVIGANLFFVGNGTHTITSPAAAYKSFAIRIMGGGSYALTNPMIATGTLATDSYFQHTGGSFSAAGHTMDFAYFCSRSLPELATNLRSLDITNTEINTRMSTIVAGRRTIDVSFLTSLNAAGSHFRVHDVLPATYLGVYRGNLSPIYLNPCVLNDVSFTATSGTPTLSIVGIAGIQNYDVRFNNVNFASNATIAGTSAVASLTVNNYNLTSGRTYYFTSATQQPYYVLSGINTVASGCNDLVRIQSTNPGLHAKIEKAAAPFNVNGAIVADINSTMATMNVVNGTGNNNINVTVGGGLGRTMYWVNNAGNWSDGIGHWSIGQSGGDPTINNPLGCIPRAIDDVVFDLNSFSVNGRTVTLDIDGNCRNMLWTSAAGARQPRFRGVGTQNLNVYGSLELATGMLSPYAGRITMQGVSTVANAQSIDMNGVRSKGSIWLNGGGRYDLLDSICIDTFSNGINLLRGDFRTHAHSIYASAMQLDVRGTNAADISNSKIRLFESGGGILLNVNTAYIGRHDATGIWNAAGSTIQSDKRALVIANTVPVSYGHIVMNMLGTDAAITGDATRRITFDNVSWLQPATQANGGTYMSGVFTIDTLRYARSSFNLLQSGGVRSYTVDDTLIVVGTPCNPAYIRSATVGSIARLNSTRCNFDFNFVNLREMNATTCTAAQNRSIGADEGGNTNWAITGIGALTNLGNDTTIICNAAPLNIDALGFGSIPGMTYTWSTGATANNINTTVAGTYAITVSYGPSCTATDNIVVTCLPILPIDGLVLRGVAQGAVNQLDWEHHIAGNFAQYTVERSLDGQQFAVLSSVQVGANAGAQSLAFTDAHPVGHAQYYRLRVLQANGETAYSNTVEIARSAGSFVSCHPNPTAGQLALSVSGFGENIVATVYNAAGQPVAQYALENGSRNIDLGHLPSALYTLVVRDAQGTRHSMRVQVQR
jgi:hypothetical protein